MTQKITLVHIDDDPIELGRTAQELAACQLADISFDVQSFSSIDMFEKKHSAKEHIDVFILDIHMPGKSGIEILPKLRETYSRSLLIAYSNDAKKIWEALKVGADDFVLKSEFSENLALRVVTTLKLHRQLQTNAPSNLQVVGATMQQIARRIPRILDSAVRAVHIDGESGTGKEVVVELFEQSVRKGTPFIKVNCGAIAANLLESELFGHAKGAFTGALADKTGLIQAADKGWIFLDEVAALSPSAQVALLRVIDNLEVRRVGDTESKKVNVRFVSACHESLSELVEKGRFRNDLWQRLKESHIHLSPLRERAEEIQVFIEHFCKIESGGPYKMSSEAAAILTGLRWESGNVRQLRNCIRAMTEKHVGKLLTPYAVPPELLGYAPSDAVDSDTIQIKYTNGASFNLLNEEFFLAVVEFLAKQKRRTMRGTAEVLGIPKTTFLARLKRLRELNLATEAEINALFIEDRKTNG
jgi:DNA-binding NtrC family response regulator